MEGEIPDSTYFILLLTKWEVPTENNVMVRTLVLSIVFFYITPLTHPLTFVQIIALETCSLVLLKKCGLKMSQSKSLKEINMYKVQKTKKKFVFVLYTAINKLMWQAEF